MILDVADIRFAYNGHPVLDGVGFSLGRGQLMAVLGENGAGKSTLLKCLNRILRPKTGAVYLDGENLLALSPRAVARCVGYVSQTPPDTPLTVYQSVLLGRKPHMGWTASPKDYAVVESILARLELDGLALRPVSGLSGGEVQKVMLARALAQSPKVLLLDEPTSNLDLKNQLEVMGLVRDIVRGEGLAAMVSIHDLNLALRFADSFLFLKNHRVHTRVPREELTAETIREVYGVPVALHRIGERMVVLPH